MRPPDPERFAGTVATLIGRPLGQEERIAVAVSGGPDSLALLLLASEAYGVRVRALTVDHGLRAEASVEAAGVAAVCADLGVEHATLRWEGAKPVANLQAAARAARYGLMADWCRIHGVALLATAHHTDDQAETLLLRLARGTGLGGLAGVRAVRRLDAGVMLLRPLLAERREALVELVRTRGLTPVNDPSNVDLRFDRTRARALLAATNWLDADRLAASAAHLADAEAALSWVADQAWRSRAVAADGWVTLDAAGLPRELARRLLIRAIATLRPEAALRGPDVDRLLAKLGSGGTATLAGVKAHGDSLWQFELEQRRSALSSSKVKG